MGFTDWMDSTVKKLDWMDIGFVKLSVAAIILMIAKLWPPILSFEWYWYGLVFVIAALRPMSKMFKKE